MRYFALATDYDGTLARHGIVHESTITAVQRFRASGRRLILVTGRRLEELLATFSRTDLFDLVVIENGAVLYWPETKKEQTLVDAPHPALASLLRKRGVQPLGIGNVIVATTFEHRETVLDAIAELGLELQIIFNKGAVMVLPAGVNKATGLSAVLDQLGLSFHNVVGVGDAENDHAFLESCECSAAVRNALGSLMEKVDFVTPSEDGAGVIELIDHILEDDLAALQPKLSYRNIVLGRREADSSEVAVPPYGVNLLVAGTSGGGKSTLTTGVLERLRDAKYQFFAIDPEGDYQAFEGALVLGDSRKSPSPEEVITVLEKPGRSLILNLLGVAFDQRPRYFETLYPRLAELYGRTGRPHWVIVDEAHHLLPAESHASALALPGRASSLMLISLEPNKLAPEALNIMDDVIAAGRDPGETIRQFCAAIGEEPPAIPPEELEKGKVMMWSRRDHAAPFRFSVEPSQAQPVRHSRKYAEAELTPDRSFFFRGPENKLNLRAQNLIIFLNLMDGVDEPTWLHHLQRREYSQWFRENIKDEQLASAAEAVEREAAGDAAESRKRIRGLIEQRYTLPA